MKDPVDVSRPLAVPVQRREYKAARVAEAAFEARSSRSSESEDLNHDQLVIGYLAAVAQQLDQRGITARAVRINGPILGVLGGTLTLDPTGAQTSRWILARLRWGQDNGWSATLHGANGGRLEAAVRNLPGQLVPAPVAVAHFVAGLDSDPGTIWAGSELGRPSPVDRPWLIQQLSRFARPEP